MRLLSIGMYFILYVLKKILKTYSDFVITKLFVMYIFNDWLLIIRFPKFSIEYSLILSIL